MKKRDFFSVLLFVGFGIGILYMNIFAASYFEEQGIFGSEYLQGFVEYEILFMECFKRIFCVRAIPLVMILFLGRLKINKISVVFFLIWAGFLVGIYAYAATVQLGTSGILFSLLGVIPQIFFYLPAYLIGLIYAYNYPVSYCVWEKIVVMVIFVLFGTYLECRWNPVLIKWYINMI